MELDKRIKEDKRPLTCFDLKEAEQFIGKKGYFAHCIDYYEDLKSTVFGTLSSTEDGDHSSFVCTEETFDNYYYDFFIPEDWVLPEEPEKKYRPLSYKEFSNIFKVGDLVEFRYKDSDEVKCAMFTGYITDVDRIDDKNPGSCELMLGCFHYSLLSLFKECELFLDGEWQPFGIEFKE